MKLINKIALCLLVVFTMVCSLTACSCGDPDTYTVKFMVDGTEYVTSQSIQAGNKATKPATDPTKQADAENTYTFAGWYNGEVAWDFDIDIVNSDITLTARFNATALAETFTVTYKDVNGQVIKIETLEKGTAVKDVDIDNPVKTPTNTEVFTFRNWVREDGKSFNYKTYKISENIVLVPDFRTAERKYNVTYQVSGENWITSPYSYNAKITELTPEDKADDETYYYDFAYWVDVESGEQWNFATDTVTKDTTLKAMYRAIKHPVEYETFEKGEDIPDYEWEREAAYGDEPDLDYMVIDGQQGANEGWENQSVYKTGTIQHNVYYSLTTKFSEKGLYVFAQADDRTGIIYEGMNYMYGHTNFKFYITSKGTSKYTEADVKLVQVDSNNVHATYVRSKTAIFMAEGAPNTGRAAKMNVEIFMTWAELGLDEKPSEIKIFTVYTYKRVKGSKNTFDLYAPFSEDKQSMDNYIVFNENGYAMGDDKDTKVGDSSLGIAKSVGWKIDKANDEDNAYVESNSSNTETIFFTDVTSNNYEFEASITPLAGANTNGKAGFVIYKHRELYSMLLFDINKDTYQDGGFKKARASIRRSYEGGQVKNFQIDEVEIKEEDNGKLKVKIIVAESYIYYIVNDVLIYCEFVQELNGVTIPGLASYNANKVRYTDYSLTNLENSQAIKATTSKYAYVVNAETTNGIAVQFDKAGVKTDGENSLTMTVINPSIVVPNQAKTQIINSGNFSGVSDLVVLVDKVYTYPTGSNFDDTKSDITTNYLEKAQKGEYTLSNIACDTSIKLTTKDANNLEIEPGVFVKDRLVAFSAKLVSSVATDKNIDASATVTVFSNNPRWGKYTVSVSGGELFFIGQAGYSYWINIVADGFKYVTNYAINNGEPISIDQANTVIEIGKTDEASVVENHILIEPHIVGTMAESTTKGTENSTGFTQQSNPKTWDLEPESDGYIYFEAQKIGAGQVYFSGPSISDHTFVWVDITNVTDTQNNSVYEPDPSAGFYMRTQAGNTAYIGLRYNSLRILKNAAVWELLHVAADNGNKTVGELPKEVNGKMTYTTTRLEMLKIGRFCYMYVTNVTGIDENPELQVTRKFVSCIELSEAFDKETAIGFHVTSAYYSKLKFSNYGIKVDDEAKDVAKTLIVCAPELDDSAYMNSRKPVEGEELIELSGLTEVTYRQEDREPEYIVYSGTKMTVSLKKENTDADKIYTITAGDNKIILSHDNPTAELMIDDSCLGNFKVKVSSNSYVKLSGKVEVYDSEGNEQTINQPLSGVMVSATGGEIPFTTDAEGNFSVNVNKNGSFKPVINYDLYATESTYISAIANANIGVVKIHESIVGGNAGNLKSSVDATLGYNNSTIGIVGPYIEVNTTIGDNWQILHQKEQYGNFVLKFSYYREKVEGVANEVDPGFGIRVNDGGQADSIMFYQTGIRCLYAGKSSADKEQQTGLNTRFDVREFNKSWDFMIIRKEYTYFMYSKAPTESDDAYKLMFVFESEARMSAATVGFVTTNTIGSYNHYYIYNMDMQEFDYSNIPEIIQTNYEVINNTSGDDLKGTVENGSYEIVGGTEIDEEIVYAYNDVLVITLKPEEGYVVAYVKANGEIIPVEKNVAYVTLKEYTELEIVFEDEYEVRQVSASISGRYFKNLPASINVYAQYQDGRIYEFKNTPVKDGKVSIELRDGEFTVYAVGETVSSKGIDVVIDQNSSYIGELVLDVMNVGNVYVNNTYKESYAMKNYVVEHGGYVVVDRYKGKGSGQMYMSEAISEGNTFFFSTKLTMSGNPTSPFYTPDNVHGISLTNGARTLAIMFWDNSLRVCSGGYSSIGEMVKVKIADSYYYDKNRGVDETHEIAVLGSNDGTIKVYADKKLVLTLTDMAFDFTGTNSSITPTTGNENGELNMASIVGDIMSSSEIACGYAMNVNVNATGTLTNALFHDSLFSQNIAEIEQILADYQG